MSYDGPLGQFVSEKGTILSCLGCNPFPLVGAVHLVRRLAPERFV